MKNKKYFCVFILLIFAGKINSIYLQPAADATKVIGSGSLPIPIIDNPATSYQYLTTGIVFAAGYIVYKVLTRVLDSNDKLAEAIDRLSTTLTNRVDILSSDIKNVTNKVDKMDDDIAALRQQK